MSSGKRVGYVRVSTNDQRVDRQKAAIGDVDEWYEDKCSGKDRHRPELEACLRYLRNDDTLVVASADRLARNLIDLCQIVEELTSRKVTVEFVKENMTFLPDKNDPRAKLYLHMLAAMAEFERALIRERQAEGIALAKAQGKYKGRAPALTLEQKREVRARYAEGGRVASIAREFGVSRPTVYRALNEGAEEASVTTA